MEKFVQQSLNPPVGISHVTHFIEDLYSHKLNGVERLYFHPAAQPNSHPHLGTVTTLCCTFALAGLLQDRTGVEPDIVFWSLENAPGEIIETDKGAYYRTLEHTLVDGEAKSVIHIRSFMRLIDRLKTLSGLDCRVVSYKEFQSTGYVREIIIRMIKDEQRLAPLLCPSEERFKVRFACPKCHYATKNGGTLVEASGSRLVYENECFEHGRYTRALSIHNDELFDINTPARALAREAYYIDKATAEGAHNMMSDGADWAHFGAINIEALSMLGFRVDAMPMRFFAPVITDWTGAKLAKSAQVGSDAYKNIPSFYVDFSKMLEEYGDSAIDRLWHETRAWMENPKKIFRNYSIDYLSHLFEELRHG